MPVQAESQTPKTTPTAIVRPERPVEKLPADRNPFLVYVGPTCIGPRLPSRGRGEQVIVASSEQQAGTQRKAGSTNLQPERDVPPI
jgi:hypothetical protein